MLTQLLMAMNDIPGWSPSANVYGFLQLIPVCPALLRRFAFQVFIIDTPFVHIAHITRMNNEQIKILIKRAIAGLHIICAKHETEALTLSRD